MAAPGALFWAVSAGTPLLRSWRPRNHASVSAGTRTMSLFQSAPYFGHGGRVTTRMRCLPRAAGSIECPGAADPGPPAPPEQRTGVGK